jgi:uncharacterized integral membrane protein
MATRKKKEPEQHWIMQLLPLETLKDAQNLWKRFEQGKAFRLYVYDRILLVIPVLLLILVTSVACSAAIIVSFSSAHPFFALPAIILMPAILVGSLLVQVYVFFSWLENRAMAKSLVKGSKRKQGAISAWIQAKLGANMGTPPPVPWALATVVLFVPLAMLASFALNAALVLVVLAIVAPIVFAILDR